MRIIRTILGIILLIAGVILTPLPIPFGLILFTIGLILVISSNDRAKRMLTFWRRKWSWLNKTLLQVEKVLPDRFAKYLRQTNPELDTDDEEKKPDSVNENTASPSLSMTFLSRKPAHPPYRLPSRPR